MIIELCYVLFDCKPLMTDGLNILTLIQINNYLILLRNQIVNKNENMSMHTLKFIVQEL